ncbi:MAG: hypothetical protein JWR07_1902 [Nevskia sp.]|nr:hypothetical protein [Nevskia sp.]
MVNPPPFGAPADSNGDKLSVPWTQWFSQLFTFINTVTDYTAASIQSPVNGFSIAVADRITVLTLTPAGALAAGTIVMPPNPVDGLPVCVSSTFAVTALTVSPNTGQSIKNAPTTLAAGVGFKYYYNKISATWYRLL